MTAFLPMPSDQPIALDRKDGHHRPAHVIDRDSVVAVNAALATGRPLLVRGEPGVGKSQLARAAATQLGWRFRAHAVDASTEPRDLLYTVDAVARLAQAQLLGALGTGAMAEVAIEHYVRPGPLWWAFDWGDAQRQEAKAVARVGGEARPDEGDGAAARGVVLLIDEVDKADSAVPNALLDALGHRRFEVPGCRPVVMGPVRPLVLITTNEERSLPDAFLRRCFVLHLGLPDAAGAGEVEAALRARGRAHFPDCSDELLAQAASLIASRRSPSRREAYPPPGVAEYIDLIDAVLGRARSDAEARALLEEVSPFVLHKHARPSGGGRQGG